MPPNEVFCNLFVSNRTMKLVSKNLAKDGSGTMKLLPDEAADLWHAYNIIAPGDIVKASTFRLVSRLICWIRPNSYMNENNSDE